MPEDEKIAPKTVEPIPLVHLGEQESRILRCLDEMREKRKHLEDIDYKPDPVLERKLEDFTRAFLSVPQSFDLMREPALQFVGRRGKEFEKTRAWVIKKSDRFRISTRVLRIPESYVGRFEYGSMRSDVDATHGDCWMDAPFGYVLEFRNAFEEWEVIAQACAFPDFKTGELLVDQLQGNGKYEYTLSPQARSARAMLTTATCVPFLAMKTLAERGGFSRVGLREPEAIMWSGKQSIVGATSPYRKVPEIFHMRKDEADPRPYKFLRTN